MFHKKAAPQRKLLRAELGPKLLRSRLKRAQIAVAELIPLFPDQTTSDPELALVVEAGETLQRLQALVKGSEPAWMQDVRGAQRAIEAHRRTIARPGPADPQ